MSLALELHAEIAAIEDEEPNMAPHLFAEWALEHVLGVFARRYDRARVRELAERALATPATLPAPAPSVRPPPPPTHHTGAIPTPCRRFTTCGRYAVKLRWDPREGEYTPVCAEHMKGAAPMELLELPARTA